MEKVPENGESPVRGAFLAGMLGEFGRVAGGYLLQLFPFDLIGEIIRMLF